MRITLTSKSAIGLMSLVLVLTSLSFVEQGFAQRNRNNKNRRGTDVPEHPQEIGESGIAWYTTWKTGLAEAKRSNRPIFFMSAATTCSGVSGVF